MSKSIALTLLGLLITLQAGPVFADKPRFGDTLSFAVGGMRHKGTGQIASTRPGAPVEELRLRYLGISERTEVFWGDFSWQFAERWQFSLNYSSFDADGFAVTTESGNFGGLDWEVGAALTTNFDLRLYIADVTWDFLKTEKSHLGLGLGLHAADLDMDMLLEVGGSIGGGGGVVEVRAEEASVLAPLPNLSLVGGVMLADNLYLSGRAGYLSLNIDKYDGRLLSLRGALEWRPWKNVGVGAAYQYVDLDVEVDEPDSTDLYDVKFYGPILFLSAGF